jgi:hypothetical protein
LDLREAAANSWKIASQKWEGLLLMMTVASRKALGHLKKIKSLSNISKNMDMEAGEPFPNLQVWIHYTTPNSLLSLSLSQASLLCAFTGLNRCGKSCRLRWTNYLRPDIKRGKFSQEEEQTILNLHAVLGNK